MLVTWFRAYARPDTLCMWLTYGSRRSVTSSEHEKRKRASALGAPMARAAARKAAERILMVLGMGELDLRDDPRGLAD